MSIISYSVNGSIFKLALEHGKEPSRYHESAARWGLVVPLKKPGAALTMARLRKLVADKKYVWCGYSDQRGKDGGVVGWLVGVDDTGSDYACFSAPNPSDLGDLRKASINNAAIAKGGGKAPPRTTMKTLIEAIQAGDERTVEELAPVGARGSYDGKNKYGGAETFIPLHEAANLGHAALIEILAPFVDVDMTDAQGRTALFVAVDRSKRTCVETLLTIGANPLHVDKYGQTCLMVATRKEDGDIFQRLLPISNCKAQDLQGRTALWVAVNACNAKNVQALLPVSDTEARDDKGRTVLMLNAASDTSGSYERSGWARSKIGRAILEHGADVDAADSEGLTALMRLVAPMEGGGSIREERDIAELLLDFGADAQRIHPDGDSSLMLAARRKLWHYFNLLLPRSDARHRGAGGDTALILAAKSAHLDSVRALVPLSDLDAQNDEGLNALMSAASFPQSSQGRDSADGDRVRCFLRLLPRSDMDAQDLKGQTVLMRLIDKDQQELFELALPKANALVQDAEKRTALMMAARTGAPAFFNPLLPVSDLKAVDKSGKTALMHAAERCWPNFVAALMDGSEVDHCDVLGQTALMLAAQARDPNRKTVAEILLRVADARIKDKEGRTAAELTKQIEIDDGLASMLANEAYNQQERQELRELIKPAAKRPRRTGPLRA